MYANTTEKDISLKKAQVLANTFAEQEGRRPRIMLVKMGLNDNDLKITATKYADIGFDVDIGSLSLTPTQIAKQAVENDVHTLYIAFSSTEDLSIVPKTIQALKAYERNDIIVMIGSEPQKNDNNFLFGPETIMVSSSDTKINETAIKILEILIE
jgi:methylmalonyl-CoA mutase